MAEQNYQSDICYPAEGRWDVAADLDEEKLNAYSAHHVGFPSPEKKKVLKFQQQQGQQQIIEAYYPAEGRPDVAADLDEEKHNAYSAHHRGTTL